MNDEPRSNDKAVDYFDCFGEYKRGNPLCSKYCALRLRCAIEQDQNLRLELIEELVDKGYEVAPGDFLEEGMYFQQGEILTVFPANSLHPLRIEIAFDKIESMDFFEQSNGKISLRKMVLLGMNF